MNNTSNAIRRATMPAGKNSVLDRRTLEKGNEHVIPFLKPEMRVLDVGCGTAAITYGMAPKVSHVTGIDVSKELLDQAKANFGYITNLSLEEASIFDYETTERFDLITAARTLQWLENPADAVKKMISLLAPGGVISILDYNHEKIEWDPKPPLSMRRFYDAFLAWRKDAGMNNHIADDLQGIFFSLGLKDVIVQDASEVSVRGAADFHEDVAIWTKVAEGRGKQVALDGFVTESERMQAIEDYNDWNTVSAKSMKMYLLSVSGRLN